MLKCVCVLWVWGEGVGGCASRQNTYLGLLNDICKLSYPDKAVLGCNQEETIATVQR